MLDIASVVLSTSSILLSTPPSSIRILLELGGVDNNIDEVLNTTEAISNILYYYIKG